MLSDEEPGIQGLKCPGLAAFLVLRPPQVLSGPQLSQYVSAVGTRRAVKKNPLRRYQYFLVPPVMSRRAPAQLLD